MLRIRLITLLLYLPLVACNGEIYVRDGVTDGDTFYLSPQAMTTDDPVVLSWVSYSLAKSTCQLQHDAPNPARATSFDCEVTARRLLSESWQERTMSEPSLTDRYLDELAAVQVADFLDEYVAHYFAKNEWEIPEGLRTNDFANWQANNLRRHKPQTKLTGSWIYKN